MEETGRAPSKHPQPRYTPDLLATLVLSLAAVGSAYSVWQSSRWGGIQSTRYAQASAQRTESTRQSSQAAAQLVYDATSFVQLMLAYQQGDPDHALALSRRIARPEFRPFLEEWMALDPLTNPKAPPTPFDLPNFRNARTEQATATAAHAEALFEEGLQASARSDAYVLTTVIFAMVLFFAGIALKLPTPQLRGIALGIGMLGLFGAVIRMLMLPLAGG